MMRMKIVLEGKCVSDSSDEIEEIEIGEIRPQTYAELEKMGVVVPFIQVMIDIYRKHPEFFKKLMDGYPQSGKIFEILSKNYVKEN